MRSIEIGRRFSYENYASPESVPEFELVPLKAPSGDHLTDYRGVARKDNQEVVSVVSSRYGLVGHSDAFTSNRVNASSRGTATVPRSSAATSRWPSNRPATLTPPGQPLCNTAVIRDPMTLLHVRKAGNSLALLVPKEQARALNLHEGDAVQVEIRKVPTILELAGTLKGKVSAAELHALTNEGEDLG